MRRTSYMRGFVAGELTMVEWIARQLAVERNPVNPRQMVESLGPVATVAGLVGKGIGGVDIEPHDYDEWVEEELRDERRRIEIALEGANYLGVRRGEDEETLEARAIARVPEHLREGLVRYLEEHIQPGHFLMAVCSNDLSEAMGRADVESRAGLFELCSYLYNFAPTPAWGSKRAVEAWLKPPMPVMELEVEPSVELEVDAEGKTACPQCGGRHRVHATTADPGVIMLPSDNGFKHPHQVQYVWCHKVHCRVVGVEGCEVDS